MKKLILFLMLLCFTVTMNAQKYELYRCEKTWMRDVSTSLNTKWNTSFDVNFIIRFDLTNNKIEFENEAQSKIHLVSKLSSSDHYDKDGDEYLYVKWRAYDQNGKRLHFVSMDYYELLNRVFVIEYSDIEIMFFCTFISPNTNNTM